jgi:SNF2 family DNA or RNA helicase
MTYPVKGKARSHQVRALAEAWGHDGHCYFVDPGGGKTFLSIADAGRMYDEGLIDGVIVIAPNGVHEQWIDQQFPQWCGVPWTGHHNRAGKRALGEFLKPRHALPYRPLGVIAINYEALRTNDGEALLEAFVALYPRYLLVVDESHKVKSPTAQRTKETMRWALRARFRRILSGTPVLRGLEDLWSQYETCIPGLGWPHEPIRLLPRGKVHTYGFTGFKSHYCITRELPSNPRAKIIVGYRNEEHLRERVAPFVTRIKSSEFAVMEEPDVIEVPTPMTASQAAQYHLMENALIAQIDGGVITAQNALVQLGKLMQIAAGFLYREDANDEQGPWQVLGSNKIEAALDLLDQLDEPVLIWAPYRAQQQMLMIELNDRVEMGKPEARPFFHYQGSASVAAWEATTNGVLFGNQGSGMGVGLNLQHSAANIYLSNTFSAEARWQSIKRTDRMGQTRQVRIWDLTTPGTVETKVMKALEHKEDISRRNIDDLRRMLQ